MFSSFFDTIKVKENNDEKFQMLTITRMSNPRDIVYQDKFINDITNYINDKGQYIIENTSKQGLNTTQIYFYFNNFEKEN